MKIYFTWRKWYLKQKNVTKIILYLERWIGEMSKWWNGQTLNGEMVKWVIHDESIASVPFTFTTTIYQQENWYGYFNRVVLNSSRLAVRHIA